MALFGMFKSEKPVGFTYHPRYYDEKKDALHERLKEARELVGDDPEMLKSRIRRNLRRRSSYLNDKNYRQQRLVRSNLMLLVIIVVLIVVTYAVLELYLPTIIKYFE